MPTAYLTRIVEFTATHRFPPGPEFGAAAHAHSHRYACHVTVRGPFDPAQSGVMSLRALGALLEKEIVQPLDGRSINDDIPAFADGKWLTTGEGLAVYLWDRIRDQLPKGVTLHAIRVQEGPHLYSEYRGDA
ncbi:MAG TPA: 6-carboxytetrahydropterin synthase [Gemmatimonadales bacterium]|jgi:6-pyruvoyl-tetrahydropterin synthase|nr:6-carboxytetrahydropterin synthase [Gemmatimonadales bacterium]